MYTLSDYFNLKIEDIFTRFAGLHFIDNGPLHHPIKSQNIHVTESGKIQLITTAECNATTNNIEYPPGTIRVNDNLAILESCDGTKIELRGIQPLNSSENHNYERNIHELLETSSVREIYCQISLPNEHDIQIEYISNLEKQYLFPDLLEINKTIKDETILKNINLNKNLKIENFSRNNLGSRSALYLKINGIGLYLVSLKENKLNNGVIVYEKNQPDDIRNKIRDCISFCLGKRLYYHGYLILNQNYECSEFSYASHKFADSNIHYHASMPSPLGKGYYQLGSEESNRLVNALFNYYEKYNLQHILWRYWYALEAPLPMAAAHFGACIEAFQSAYISSHSESFPKKLIQDTNTWSKLRKELLNTLSSIELPDIESQTLRNKLNNLNHTPQSIITRRFFEKLGMNLSELETNAFKERNYAAHGKSTAHDEYDQQIRNIKLLKCLFHRILLISTKGSDLYFDYYSYNQPARNLQDSISEAII